MTMTLASLQMALEEYPDRLQRALTRQSRAKTALKRIKEQIEEKAVCSLIEKLAHRVG